MSLFKFEKVNSPQITGTIGTIGTPNQYNNDALTVLSGSTVTFNSGSTLTLASGSTLNTTGAVIVNKTVANTTAVTVNTNVTTAQSLMTYTVPAAGLNVLGKAFHYTAGGLYTTQSAQTPTITFILSLGGVAIATWVSGATTAAKTNFHWDIDGDFLTTAIGASGTIYGHGELYINLGASETSATTYLDANTAASSAVNLTTTEALLLTATFSTNAATANIVTQDVNLVTFLN